VEAAGELFYHFPHIHIAWNQHGWILVAEPLDMAFAWACCLAVFLWVMDLMFGWVGMEDTQ
jgi:hypothetical protein